ncbi:MAG TPA: hypothetical protein VF158_12360 [Longimicrobiales bacterium]
MPIGAFINVFPPVVFMVIHAALLVVGVYLAVKAMGAYGGDVATPFWLYALAELFYLTYHLDWTVILFAHTVAEVLDAVAIVLLFVAFGRRAVAAAKAGARATAGVS